jgi:uncharacterized protein with PIN domain
MIFLADHMLGSLARWLRFLGFDCAYPDATSDKELKEIVKREKRVLLTRDKELSRAKDITAFYIESTDLEDQLIQVVENFDLKTDLALSRCSLCNSILEEIEKKEVEGKVPQNVFSLRDEFWECKQCGKYYWKGTHYEGIKKTLEELERKSSGL